MDANYAKFYEQLYRRHWWWRAREEFVLKVIGEAGVQPNGRVLDVGCGGGWAFERLNRFGEVSGVEVDSVLAESAGKQRASIYVGPFDRRFQPKTKFSLIVMLDVLEHLSEPIPALEYAVELLESDGTLVVTVPAMPWLWTNHDDLNHHFQRYTKASFRQLSENSGLQIKRLQYFFHWLTPLKLLVRFKEKLLVSQPELPAIPPPTINMLFKNITRLEQRLLARVPLPFGSSLLCVGRRGERL